MYNIQENVRIVIAALKAYNIRHIVVSPGGTNIPISQAVQEDPFFHCYSVVDERSAMYFAIGIYLQTGEIVATSCTSAQATRNYLPGLTEAFYKHVPILAITTSKLERYSYQDYMQAPDQVSIPRDAVKASFDLPPVNDDNTRAQCFKDAKKAILELTHHGKGPVQLNIRITDSLNSRFSDALLPEIRKTVRYNLWENWDNISLIGKKVLVVVGEHRPFSDEEKQIMEAFCDGNNVVVYTNHLSNYRGKYSINANLLISSLSDSEIESLFAPDVLITLGGQTGDYPLFGLLNHPLHQAEHWRVAEDGNYVDTYGKLTKIFECPEMEFLKRMSIESKSEHSYFDLWRDANAEMTRDVDIPFSNIYAASRLTLVIPEGSYVNFAILNSLRAWSYFDIPNLVSCFSNVAAFGIDGCTSTLIGESMNTNALCYIITGDLAFFYDMNALGIRHIKNNVRILLINNGGGAEFKIMTNSWSRKPDTAPFISAMGHNGSAKGWADACGFKYLYASSKTEFDIVMNQFVEDSECPVLFELFTDSDDEVTAMTNIVGSNKKKTSIDRIKSVIRRIIGSDFVRMAKNM